MLLHHWSANINLYLYWRKVLLNTVTYKSSQGLYYRKPLIPKKFILTTFATLVFANLLGILLFGVRIHILIICLIAFILLLLAKKHTDGGMQYRQAPSESEISFFDDSISIRHCFKHDKVETFKSIVCNSNGESGKQHYHVQYDRILHVFWIPEESSYVLVVQYPRVVSPLSFVTPRYLKKSFDELFHSYMNQYPEESDISSVINYIHKMMK